MVRRSGVLVCQTSLYTPDAEIPASTYHSAGVRDSVGTVSTSPVGDGCSPAPLDTAGMVPLSPVVDGCPPCRPSVPLSGHHAERSRRPAMRSQYPVPGGYPRRPTTLAGYEGVVRSPRVHTLWSLLGLPASGSPIMTSHQTLPLDYGTAGANHRRQPECSCCQGLGPSTYPARSSPSQRLMCSLLAPPLGRLDLVYYSATPEECSGQSPAA